MRRPFLLLDAHLGLRSIPCHNMTVEEQFDVAVVGAPGNDDAGEPAYIFERNHGGADNWGEVMKLTASDAAVPALDAFGWSVSISGDAIIVGASAKDDDGEQSGAAYIYTPEPGTLGLVLLGLPLLVRVRSRTPLLPASSVG